MEKVKPVRCEWISLTEAARAQGISKNTLNKLRLQKKFVSRKITEGKYQINAASFDAWLKTIEIPVGKTLDEVLQNLDAEEKIKVEDELIRFLKKLSKKEKLDFALKIQEAI